MLTVQSLLSQVRGWSFHNGIDEIERAYLAARREPEIQIGKLEAESDRLKAQVASGELTEIDPRDAEDFEEHLNELYAESFYTIDLIREAFAIALFHYWERVAKRWMSGGPDWQYKSREVGNFLERGGYKPNRYELRRLELIANVVKHSQGRSAKELFELDARLFKKATIESEASYESLELTDDIFSSLLAAVRSSGPPRDRPRF